MIKKLRIRFIIIVMVIVSIMLCLISGSVMHFSQGRLENNGYEMLESIVKRPRKPGMFRERPEEISLPYFIVEYDGFLQKTTYYGGYYDLSDTESIEKIIEAAGSFEKDRGYISEYSMSFVKHITPMGYIMAFADISSQKNASKELFSVLLAIDGAAFIIFLVISIGLSRWVVRPVEKAWNQQTRFISDASHELKTPLTTITTNAELLASPDATDTEKLRYADNILTVSHQMRELVEDLLSLSRAENGSDKNHFEIFDLSGVVLEAVLLCEPVYFEDGLIISEDIDEGININGYPSRITQVANILLDNARKYSDKGEVKISLKKEGKNAVLSVENPGVPLTKEQCTEIFKRFYRADEARNEKGSYGLGLAIAEGICKSHGGSIKAEPAAAGNRFIVRLPLANKNTYTLISSPKEGSHNG